MNKSKITLPLAGPKSYSTNHNGVHHVFVTPTKKHNLNQIPKGVNPRAIDDKNKISKLIKDSLERQQGNFAAKNGGLQVLVDPESVRVVEKNGDFYIDFSCMHPLTGHFDGQHTKEAATKFVNDFGSMGNESMNITLTESNTLPNISDIRGAAQAINTRSPQKPRSEENVMGTFDILKSSLSYTDLKNISWEENARNVKGEKHKADTSVEQLLRIMSTLGPLTNKRGSTLSCITKLAKGGETAAIKHFKKNDVMKAAAPFIDSVLAISDYIQENCRRLVGEEDSNNYAIFKQATASQLDKKAHQRKWFNQRIFRTGEQQEGCLDKDYMLPLMYSVTNNCFNYSTDGFSEKYTLTETKAIIEECGAKLLKTFDQRFETDYTKVFKSRKSDFINDETLWNELDSIVKDCIASNKWKSHLQQNLAPAA